MSPDHRLSANQPAVIKEAPSDHHGCVCSPSAMPTMDCPMCGFAIGALQGSKDAICHNCGFKLPCCGD